MSTETITLEDIRKTTTPQGTYGFQTSETAADTSIRFDGSSTCQLNVDAMWLAATDIDELIEFLQWAKARLDKD